MATAATKKRGSGGVLAGLRDLLGRADAPETTAADVERALERTTEEITEAQARLSELEDDRAELLLTASDERLAQHDRAIGAARNDVARLRAAYGRLAERLEAVRAREAAAAVDANLERARELRAQLDAGLAKYEEHAAAIASLLEELRPIADRLDNMRRGAPEARRDEFPDGGAAGKGFVSILGARQYGERSVMVAAHQVTARAVQLPSTRGFAPHVGDTSPYEPPAVSEQRFRETMELHRQPLRGGSSDKLVTYRDENGREITEAEANRRAAAERERARREDARALSEGRPPSKWSYGR
ncbi:MAG TPA: hypothetical protein VML95_02105 [Longimicrobiales bacterium]|nr:hypothetical protein [Longimicrobiales bacterium]